jgi:multiple sugar transport system permease protein
MYIPTISPSVGAAVAWVVILSPQFGLLNGALKWLGIKGPGWFLSPVWAKPAIILMSLWVLGGLFVIFLAGLQGIPNEYYEAASIDGANSWISFRKITLPLMTPTILFNLVMNSIWAFQVFQESFVTTGPLRSTYFLSLYIYDQAFTYRRMGYASAISWVMFIVIMVFTIIILRSSRKWTFYGGGEQ